MVTTDHLIARRYPFPVTWLTVLTATLILLTAFTYWSMITLRQYGLFIRYVPVADLSEVHPTYHYSANSMAELDQDFTDGSPLELLTQVMNRVSTIDNYITDDPLVIYNHALAGGGLVCEGMSKLFHGLLTAKGIQARIVGLKRNLIGSYDTHTTVEIFVDGQWVIYDPTFHISFEEDGKLIGAQEVKRSFYNGSYSAIRSRFYGEVVYPSRLDSYYMDWLPLFNNVLIWAPPEPNLWAKLPPFRYWWGSIFYYEPLMPTQIKRYNLANQLYFGVVVVLPLILILLGLTITFLCIQPFWRWKYRVEQGVPAIAQ